MKKGRMRRSLSDVAEAQASDTPIYSVSMQSDLLLHQREVLEQMQICTDLIERSRQRAGRVRGHSNAAITALEKWYEALASAAATSADAAIGLLDIVTEPNPGKRAMAFFPIVDRSGGRFRFVST